MSLSGLRTFLRELLRSGVPVYIRSATAPPFVLAPVAFSNAPSRWQSSDAPSPSCSDDAEQVSVTFNTGDGLQLRGSGAPGDTLLDVVVNKQVPLDGYGKSGASTLTRRGNTGACEGTLACSTCHVILSQHDYDALPDTPSDEELDMLDLAYGLTDTSRLGCQVVLTKEMNGLEVSVPTVVDARLG